MNDLHAFLRSNTISDVVEKQKIVYHNANDLVCDLIATLVNYKILSVPVKKDGKFGMFVDVLDVLYFIVKGGDAKTATCESICDASGRDPFDELSPHSNLIKVMATMCMKHQNLHRVAIVDHGKLVGILTQLKLVKYLAPHTRQFDFGNQTIKECKLGNTSAIYTLPHNATAADASKSIVENKVSCVAIVDDDGKLVGSFSASDIRIFGVVPSFDDIAKTSLANFCDKVQQITVRSSETCAEVVDKISDASVHRVWIVDDDDKPVGIVALIEIIEQFWRHIVIE